MKKIFLSIVLFNLFSSFSYAQSGYFNNDYIFNNLWTTGRAVVNGDSVYYVAALSHDTIDTIYAVKRISLCKFDNNGNLLHRKSIGWGNNNFYLGYSGCFQKTSDKNYFVVGVKEDTIVANAFLLKVNANFDTLFFKEYADTTFKVLEFQQGKETYDKGFILVGTLPGAGTYDQNILALKTDSLGNEQWRKIYSLSGYDLARNVIQTPDGGYLLGCNSIYIPNYLSGDGWLLKLDVFGNIEWTRSIGGPNRDGIPVVAIDKDSNYIVATSYAYETIFGGGSRLKIQVLKIDKSDHSIIWDKQYDTVRNSNYPNTVKVLDNETILITGVADIWDGINYYGASWILKLNSNGDSLLYRQFWKYNDEHTTYNWVYDFCVTNEKSIVICGEVKLDTAYNYLWLAKMDSLGCLQPGCDIVGIEEIKPDIAELIVFPNPANNSITFNTGMYKDFNVTIFNAIGQTVLQKQLTSSNNILNIQSFQSGMYYYQLINDKGKVISGKFVKE